MASRVRVEWPIFGRAPFLPWLVATLMFLWIGGCTGMCTGLSVARLAGVDTRRPGISEAADTAAGVGFLAGMALVILIQVYRRYPEWFRSPPAEQPEIPSEENQPDPPLSEAVFLGTSLAEDRNTPTRVFLDHPTRNRHVYLIGKTRTGKTSVMRNMIEQDMQAGHGLCFIDPHGDAAEDLLGVVPDSRIDDVLYFDPTNPCAPAFNPLALPYQPAKLTEDIVSVFQMLVGESWGPRLEHILRFSVLTLIADPEAHCIADLKRILLDEAYRIDVVSRIENRQIQDFWALEFPVMPKAAPAPILNKLSAFLAPMSDLERVFSTPRNDLDFTDLMASGGVLIVNLAKGILGDEPSRLLGGLLVAGIQQAALARAALPEHMRRDFYLYVDEFQNYTVSSFKDILSESAKYRLNLTLAHQNLGQVPDYLRRAIFGNVGTLIAYQLSAQDALVVGKEMHRSSLLVRAKSSNVFISLDTFIQEKKAVYEAALEDPFTGMPRAERYRFENRFLINSANTTSAAKIRRKNNEAGAQLEDRRRVVHNTYDMLHAQTIDIAALKHLFPDWEFRDEGFPTVEDFVNLPPHRGYIRIGTASNVMPLAPPHPTAPDPGKRSQILARLRAPTAPEPSTTNPIPHDNDFITAAYDDDPDEAVSA